MKIKYIIILFLTFTLSCKEKSKVENAVSRVGNTYLFEDEIINKIPKNLSKEDSIVYRNNLINEWAIDQLLYKKSMINVEDKHDEIKKLVENYKKGLYIDRYIQAIANQEIDTVISESDIEDYYNQNKNIYKLNEDLIQFKYIHFNAKLNDKKEIIKLFKSEDSGVEELIDRELEFNSYNFNDSIWVSLNQAQNKLPIIKKIDRIKNNQFIQKEDSLGVYLLAIKNVLHRNDIAPKSYVAPAIKQMILHKRKLDLIKQIKKTLINDAINNKQFEQY